MPGPPIDMQKVQLAWRKHQLQEKLVRVAVWTGLRWRGMTRMTLCAPLLAPCRLRSICNRLVGMMTNKG